MLTVKKLLSLKERTRTRKISMILSDAARVAKTGQTVDVDYVNTVSALVQLEPIDKNLDTKHLAFKLEDNAQILLSRLGAEPSDWDFTDDSGALDVSKRVIFDRFLILDRIRSPYNVGAIFRSADSFGIRKVILAEGTASPEHVRARRTSRGTTETVQWEFMSDEQISGFLTGFKPEEIIALELGGTDISLFTFPQRGVVILGSEEFGISPEILNCCGNRVTINTAGTKGSLNVSVAAGIMLQRWFSC